MPIGAMKNTLYGLALPALGMRPAWRAERGENRAAELALHNRHVVGGCVQRFERGRLTDCLCVGSARLKPFVPVSPDTVFRAASIAKMVTALLVFRLQTLGRLSVDEDVSEWLGYPVRSPRFPERTVTLGMLMAHTSGLCDTEAYYQSFTAPRELRGLLESPDAWLDAAPGTRFRYSNLGAGAVGCALEKRFGVSLEALARTELFAPLGVAAAFDPTTLDSQTIADSYRVLPPGRAFDAEARVKHAEPVAAPNPERHYLLASGNLYLSAPALAGLALAAWDGRGGFIAPDALKRMRTPNADWPDTTVRIRHGMGLLCLDDARFGEPLWGHQGFAYGAVNGVFFDKDGNGFASLNCGASEQRTGHLALVNRDLVHLWLRRARDG